MSSAVLPLEVPLGPYPERSDQRRGRLDRLGMRVAGPFVRVARVRALHSDRLLRLAAECDRSMERKSERALREAAEEMRLELRRHGFQDELVARTFALVREAAARALGERPFDVQLIGGRVLLSGMVAEMQTGEGKTLTATLPACTAALAGIPVHIITVNDYLAARDAEWMGPIYRLLGLTVGVITHGIDAEARRAAYGCDVAYCTNKEIVFDYLRDRLLLGSRRSRVQLQLERLYGHEARTQRLLLRGLHYAIVDEADSVLIDEARTPLIISGGGSDLAQRRVYERALALADQLVPQRDFLIEGRERQVRLTESGEAWLRDLAKPLGGVWASRIHREELVRQSLTARHLFHRDQHYLVSDGKVQIIDEFTGRRMADRSWEHGLHQLIEVKEDCPITGHHETLARISYQRFFRRYLRLAGMTGTAREVARDLWSVYRLPVVSIPTNRPLHRRGGPDRMYATAGARWDAVVEQVSRIHEDGRPILIGTRSVAASERLSDLLTKASQPHRVLNALQDRAEAEIIAAAGQPGRITVATNMAGRGTDIRLGAEVPGRGGLHVIATERHEARRIDRQLFGRGGRQGDPGSHEAIISLDDELLVKHAGVWRWLALGMARAGRPLPSWIARLAVHRAQRAAEHLHARMRRDLLKLDEHLESALAFSGRPE